MSIGKPPRAFLSSSSSGSIHSNVAWVAGLLVLVNLLSLYVFFSSGLHSRSFAHRSDSGLPKLTAGGDALQETSKAKDDVASASKRTSPLPAESTNALKTFTINVQAASNDTKQVLQNVHDLTTVNNKVTLPSFTTSLRMPPRFVPLPTRFDIGKSRSTRTGWKATDNSFLHSLEGKWDVMPYSSQPGVFLLQQLSDYACLLLMQDACYLFMIGSSPVHSQYTGIWFPEDQSRDFSKISFNNDACRLYGGLRAEVEETSDQEAEEGGGGDGSDGSAVSGGGEERAEVKQTTGVKSGSQLVLSSPSNDKVQHGKQRRLLEGNGDGGNHKEARTSAEVEENAEGWEVSRGFTDEFDEPVNDLSDLKRRQPRVYGKFVSHETMQSYINSSSSTSKKIFRLSPQGTWLKMGLVPRFGSYMGNFGEALVALMEASVHLVPPPPFNLSAPDSRGEGLSLFFPGDKIVRSTWTVDVGLLLLGPKSSSFGGKVQGSKVCFRNALFAVNKLHTVRSADILRSRAAAAVEAAGLTEYWKGKELTSIKAMVGNTATARKQQRYFHELLLDQALELGGYHVTIIEKEGQRTVNNMHEVVRTVRTVLPELPLHVLRLSNISLLHQVSLMQRTVLLLCMHGSPLSNIVFIPRNAVVIELLPFKFFSAQYRKIALRSGLRYLSWANIHGSSSFYVDNCLVKGGFSKLEDEACWRIRDCVFCVRDRSITQVHRKELSEVIRNSRIFVQQWMNEHGISMMKADQKNVSMQKPVEGAPTQEAVRSGTEATDATGVHAAQSSSSEDSRNSKREAITL